MHEAQSRLAIVSDLSSDASSPLLGTLNHYASGTDEYMNKLKGLIKKDVDPKEKSFLTENIGNLKTRARNRFNGNCTPSSSSTSKKPLRLSPWQFMTSWPPNWQQAYTEPIDTVLEDLQAEPIAVLLPVI